MPAYIESLNCAPPEKEQQAGLEQNIFTLNMPISSMTFQVPVRGRSKFSCDHYKTVSSSWLLAHGTGPVEEELTSALEVVVLEGFFSPFFCSFLGFSVDVCHLSR